MKWFEKLKNKNIVTIVGIFEDKIKVLEVKNSRNFIEIQKYCSTKNLDFNIENFYDEEQQKNISSILNKIFLENNFNLENIISFIPENLVLKKFLNIQKSKKFIDIDNEIKITGLKKVFPNINDILFDYALFEDNKSEKSLNVMLLAIKNQEKNIVENIFKGSNLRLQRLDTDYFSYRNILKFSHQKFFNNNFLLVDSDDVNLKFFISYKDFPFYFFKEKKRALIKDENNISDIDVLRIKNFIEKKLKEENENLFLCDNFNTKNKGFNDIQKIYLTNNFLNENVYQKLFSDVFNRECKPCNLFNGIKMNEEILSEAKEFLSLLGISFNNKKGFFKGDVEIW